MKNTSTLWKGYAHTKMAATDVVCNRSSYRIEGKMWCDVTCAVYPTGKKRDFMSLQNIFRSLLPVYSTAYFAFTITYSIFPNW